MVAEQEDKKNERVGMIVSITVHALILIVFLFLFAYVPPDPPKPGHPGVEIAFGLETTGSGDNHDNAPVNDVQENPTEEVEPQPEPDPVEEVEPVEASHVDTESPHVIEKKETKEPTPKTEVKKETKKVEVKKVETTKETTTTKTTNSEGKGDDKDPGNKGDKNGTLNKDALYGNNPGDGGAGGNSDGTTLDLGGWRMGFSIDKKDETNENGYIVFQVKVDEEGELISCNQIQQTVSPNVVKFYKEQIQKNWVIYRERGTKTAPASIGTLKVIVKSQ